MNEVPRGFEYRETGQAKDKIICRVCGQVWVWPAGRELPISVKLTLLDHTHGHDEENKEGGAK